MARSLKILALSDGFGDSRTGPSWYPEYHKWPAILNFMLKGCEMIDRCRYGAGNEYMISCLKEYHRSVDAVLVQWASPERLDLLLAHDDVTKQQWIEKISQDPVYRENMQDLNNRTWWLSSASTVDWAVDYRDRFICRAQHRDRSRIWIEHAHLLLGHKTHGFMLTHDSAWLQESEIAQHAWIWHDQWKGMHSWRFQSQYADLDFGLVQPIPLIQFDFIKKFLLPKFDWPWRNDRELSAVESMLLRKYNQYKDQKPL